MNKTLDESSRIANQKTTRLLWLDMEMTGLEPDTCQILEVAALVTDMDLQPLSEPYEAVVWASKEVIENLDDWNQKHHTASGLLAKVPNGKMLDQVEHELIEYLKKNDLERPILSGNSIHQDRRFLIRHMPHFEKSLHYRMLDVTSWKIIAEHRFGSKFEKKNAHTAALDIQESLAELKHYLQFFQPPI